MTKPDKPLAVGEPTPLDTDDISEFGDEREDELFEHFNVVADKGQRHPRTRRIYRG